MGIPHLTATLEPYAGHTILENHAVVVDGPALAYHIFHVCRNNGIDSPSYLLLAQTAIAWLDRLVGGRVTVEAFYFDGHLPRAKLPVRMERAVKSTSQLVQLHSRHPDGCPVADPQGDADEPLNLFPLHRQGKSPPLPPAFLVPAIIEALGQCPRYGHLLRLVPGEADAFCAQHLADRGGLVLTSDSDLLAHDLGDGSVAFLRDIHLDTREKIACATFCPGQIAQSLELSSSRGLCRLAYERRCSPQASLAQIRQACLGAVTDEHGYRDFCHQYVEHETRPLPLSASGKALSLDGLDPRLSELVLQLGQSASGPEDGREHARFFLPHLLESPARGSVWEQSLPIRQLAYTIARWGISGISSSVQEYRRVQNLDQRGRQISIMSQDAARDQIDRLLQTALRLKGMIPNGQETYWTLLCLILDIRACEEQEKQSHALRILQNPLGPKDLPRVSWDLIHFDAHLQAGYYSLRMLKQILALVRQDDAGLPQSNIRQLSDALSSLPPIAQYPDIGGTLRFLKEVKSSGAVRILGEFVNIPDARTKSSEPFKIEKKMSKRRKVSNDTAKKGRPSANLFDLLSTD